MNEAEAHVNKKMSDLRNFESDANRRLAEAQNERQKIQAELALLKETEGAYRDTLEQLQQTIQHEENRIQFELDRLKEDKLPLRPRSVILTKELRTPLPTS